MKIIHGIVFEPEQIKDYRRIIYQVKINKLVLIWKENLTKYFSKFGREI